MKRYWLIRHLRWLYHAHQAARWARMWGRAGGGQSRVHTAACRLLEAIWRGDA